MAATYKEHLLDQIRTLNPEDRGWIIKELAGSKAKERELTDKEQEEQYDKIFNMIMP